MLRLRVTGLICNSKITYQTNMKKRILKSSLLKNKIVTFNFDKKNRLKNIGGVLSVKDGIAFVWGLNDIKVGEMVEFFFII